MAYREVTMIEIKEVLRQRALGVAKKRIAAQLGMDPKTVRRYLEVGEAHGIVAGAGAEQLTDARLGEVLAELKKPALHEHGDAWWECERERSLIADQLKDNVRLTKIRKLLRRQGVNVPYSTLHRFAVQQLGFGKKSATVPIVDGEPGVELQVDPGSVGFFEPDASGKRRKIKVIVFTPNVSRYRFVYPIERETTEEVIAAFEAAWAFYGGVYKAAIVDNLKAIVQHADPTEPRITDAFLEYAQARGFVIDTARVRKPKDKARVERSVRDVRDDCFAGERLRDLAAARAHAERWCRDDYGARRHSTTGRMPREHFLNLEAPALLPAPEHAYDVPRWCTPKVARDHFAQVERALYSMPTRLIGRTLRARADRTTVRFYDRDKLIRICERMPPGKRRIDPDDYPKEKRAYAMRDIEYLQKQADEHGPNISAFVCRLLAGAQPWTRMRTVYGVLALAKRHGDAVVDRCCGLALANDMLSLKRLTIMALRDLHPHPVLIARPLPPAKFLRPPQIYALKSTSNSGDPS
jgi:hypothetical protein